MSISVNAVQGKKTVDRADQLIVNTATTKGDLIHDTLPPNKLRGTYTHDSAY